MGLSKDSLSWFTRRVDANDPLVHSHEVKSPRQSIKHIPEEFKSDVGIRNFIQRVFPNFRANEKQRAQAGRWARVIQLHYKYHYSERTTAEEMGLALSIVKSIKTRIRRALKGRRLDGSGCYWKQGGKK